jgi:hypothetical protein
MFACKDIECFVPAGMKTPELGDEIEVTINGHTVPMLVVQIVTYEYRPMVVTLSLK